MAKYIEARKLIETNSNGEFEYNKIHVLRIDNESLINSLENLSERDEDDYETAYFHGFIFNDECLFSINVDRLLTHLKEEIDCEYTDIDDKENYELLIPELEKYKGYELYIKNEENKQ